MNDLVKSGEKQMTVKEVAEALGLDVSTVQKRVRELFPDLIRNGVATYLDEAQVYAVKKALQANGHLGQSSEVFSATTALEIEEMTIKVLAYHKAEAERLRAELTAAVPKIEGFNALMRSEQTMSITDAAKHFGLHPKTHVFPYLRDRAYLTKDDMPSQDAIDAGYLALRETKCPDGTVRKQAVVLVSQLETWRTRVVPQVKRWATEGAPA